jgi:hypothetical protein
MLSPKNASNKLMNEGELMEALIDEVDAADASPLSEDERPDRIMSHHFDTNTPIRRPKRRNHQCPVSSCTATLQPPPAGKRRPFCPVHEVEVNLHRITANHQ